MKTKDVTDQRCRRMFRKVCARLNADGIRYSEQDVWSIVIVLQPTATSREIAQAIIDAKGDLRAKAECN